MPLTDGGRKAALPYLGNLELISISSEPTPWTSCAPLTFPTLTSRPTSFNSSKFGIPTRNTIAAVSSMTSQLCLTKALDVWGAQPDTSLKSGGVTELITITDRNTILTTQVPSYIETHPLALAFTGLSGTAVLLRHPPPSKGNSRCRVRVRFSTAPWSSTYSQALDQTKFALPEIRSPRALPSKRQDMGFDSLKSEDRQRKMKRHDQ